MGKKPGSLIGGAFLIAGSCVGAGILGIPIVTGLCGFYPSLLIFFLSWAFMTATGLLLVEVNGWFSKDVNLISMVNHSLGRIGRASSWVLYLFLFYSLLVAYIAGSGGLFSSMAAELFSLSIPVWASSLFFVLIFGWIIFLGTKAVDMGNRLLMTGKIVSYLALVAVGLPHVIPSYLARSDVHYLFISLPIMVISFGFHNLIPTLASYMKGDIKRVRSSIWIGSLFALVVYVIWDLVVLGVLPEEGEFGIRESLKVGREASQAIAGVLGFSWIARSAQGLAFFSLITSFLMQSLALTHFWVDGLKMDDKKREPLSICALTVVPPLLLSIFYPKIFFKALDFAGGICAVILFGIFPVLMVWIGRYRKQLPSTYRMPGGKILLICLLLFSLFIFLFQLLMMTGWFSLTPS